MWVYCFGPVSWEGLRKAVFLTEDFMNFSFVAVSCAANYDHTKIDFQFNDTDILVFMLFWLCFLSTFSIRVPAMVA